MYFVLYLKKRATILLSSLLLFCKMIKERESRVNKNDRKKKEVHLQMYVKV